jgi:hypothetical protein
MKYQVWDSIGYTEGDPLMPFTKLYESDKLEEVVEYVENNANVEIILFVTLNNGTILFDSSMSIYESPDGKVVYKRMPLSNKRTKIK